MSVWEMVAVCAAGVGAGCINVIVGSGTLITFPVLLALGLPPVTANVSNSLGLVPGNIAGTIGYRKELQGQRALLMRLAPAALLGGLAGALLLLVLPSEAFDVIVPALIALALVLVVLQPWLSGVVRRRQDAAAQRRGTDGDAPAAPTRGGPFLVTGMGLASIYGGYFGAAQGVIYMALMGLSLREGLQRLNAVKNVLASLVNGVAAVVFIAVADVDWLVALLIAAGATVGGVAGARIGRRLPPAALRGVIVVVGLVAIVRLLLG